MRFARRDRKGLSDGCSLVTAGETENTAQVIKHISPLQRRPGNPSGTIKGGFGKMVIFRITVIPSVIISSAAAFKLSVRSQISIEGNLNKSLMALK